MTTEQEESGLERNPCPHGRLCEDHRHRLPFKGKISPFPRLKESLHLNRTVQHAQDSVLIEIADVQEILQIRLFCEQETDQYINRQTLTLTAFHPTSATK